MSYWPEKFDDVLKVVTIVGGLGSFIWAVVQWQQGQENGRVERREAAERATEQRRIEAQKPFLQKQLELYGEAVRTTAKISAGPIGEDRTVLLKRFVELFYGELATVENREVASAMVSFKAALDKKHDDDELRQLSLALAHAVRRSLDESWGIKVWTTGR
jgi:hypothetical protein